MTYPVFVAFLGPYLIKERNTFAQKISVILATGGVYLIIGFPSVSLGLNVNTVGLLSGLTAAIAILSLRKARESDHWLTILFYNFSLGSLAVFLLSYSTKSISIDKEILFYLIMSAISGIIGQFGLTFGFRYVTAIEGSVLSSSRILISVMATSFLGFQGLSLEALMGAFLIFIANVLAVKRIEIPLDSTRPSS
jgi:drug/metabolite transporter (DMT)-like permease